MGRGARWPSGRASDSGARGQGFDPHTGRRVVSLSKIHLPPQKCTSIKGHHLNNGWANARRYIPSHKVICPLVPECNFEGISPDTMYVKSRALSHGVCLKEYTCISNVNYYVRFHTRSYHSTKKHTLVLDFT